MASANKMKPGVYGSIVISIPLFKQFSLQPEVVVSGQGTKGTVNGIDFTLYQNYISVPVLLKYNHPSGFLPAQVPRPGPWQLQRQHRTATVPM